MIDRTSLLHLLRNDLNELVQIVLEKYYRGRFPYGMDATTFRDHALCLIKDAVGFVLEEDAFLKKIPE